MNARLATILGWYGMVAILAAFAGVSFSLLSPHSHLYLLLNLSGSLGLVADATTKRDYPVVGLNAIFAIIALLAFVSHFRS